MLGADDPRPRIICDGCGTIWLVPAFPPMWFLDGKPPRGWRGTLEERDGEAVVRKDWCGRCAEERGLLKRRKGAKP
jgi:hypothetical protein